ncbi:MAG: hypothetical protein IPM92_06030 [Saprospiraceae bacterium]|nr:hypothetical protein [Saprospiraceae bacterium]
MLRIFFVLTFISCQRYTNFPLQGDHQLVSMYHKYDGYFNDSNRAGHIEIKFTLGNHFHFFAQVDSISEIKYTYHNNDTIIIFKSYNSNCFNLNSTLQNHSDQRANISGLYNGVPWNTNLYIPKFFEIQGTLKSNLAVISKSKGIKLEWDADRSSAQVNAVLLEISYYATLNNIFLDNAAGKDVFKKFILPDTGEFELSSYLLKDFPPAEIILIYIRKVNYTNLIINGRNLPIKVETEDQSHFKLVK